MKLFILTLILLVSLSTLAWAQTAEFDGYPCLTMDCSGHQAGYDWAKKKGRTDPAACEGQPQAFMEGCQSFAEGGLGIIILDDLPIPCGPGCNEGDDE